MSGLPSHKLIEAHGGFDSAHCIKCETRYSKDVIKEAIDTHTVPTCTECQVGQEEVQTASKTFFQTSPPRLGL